MRQFCGFFSFQQEQCVALTLLFSCLVISIVVGWLERSSIWHLTKGFFFMKEQQVERPKNVLEPVSFSHLTLSFLTSFQSSWSNGSSSISAWNQSLKYSGNHHTWNNNFLVLLLTTFEFISTTISSNTNLTT